MSEAGVISRRSLHNELVPLLHDMILEGELRGGDKINEQALCARFGVSRTPLREALKVLASEGLILLAPNRGASVARITPQEIDELFPIMGALEALAGELACAHITDAEVEKIRAMHDAMVQHYEKGQAGPYFRLNRSIHEAIFAAARNAALVQFYNTLLVRTHSVRFTAKKSPAKAAPKAPAKKAPKPAAAKPEPAPSKPAAPAPEARTDVNPAGSWPFPTAKRP